MNSKHLLSTISAAVIAATAPAAPATAAEAMTCSALFAQTLHPTNLTADALIPNFDALSSASQEYLVRLVYLVNQRHLLSSKVLTRIADSPTPLNPAALTSTYPTASLTLLPHQEAYADLLKESLQWPQIREAAKLLSGVTNAEQQRADKAKEDTAGLLIPTPAANLDFAPEKIVRTATGQVLALFSRQEPGYEEKITVHAYDFATAKPVAKTTFHGDKSSWKMTSMPFASSLLVAGKVADGKRIVVVDPLEEKVNVDKGGGRGLQESRYSPPLFISLNGKPALVTLNGGFAYALDPLTGAELGKVPFKQKNDLDPAISGVVNDKVFASEVRGLTYFIDPSGKDEARSFKGLLTLGAFSFKNESFGLGIDLNTPTQAGRRDDMYLKVVNFKTGAESVPLLIQNRFRYPLVLETFEADQTVYGIVATDVDIYTIDLINGMITRKLSDTTLAGQLYLHWGENPEYQVGFEHAGKFYLLGLRYSKGSDETGRLVILDALTLEPAGPACDLSRKLSAVDQVLVVPNDHAHPQAVITYKDGTSQVISLTQRI